MFMWSFPTGKLQMGSRYAKILTAQVEAKYLQ